MLTSLKLSLSAPIYRILGGLITAIGGAFLIERASGGDDDH